VIVERECDSLICSEAPHSWRTKDTDLRPEEATKYNSMVSAAGEIAGFDLSINCRF
jgi:hypothetical protein